MSSHRVQRHYQLYLLAASLSLYPTVALETDENSMPSFCSERKPPLNGRTGCQTERRWFVHRVKGCKPFAVCSHQLEQLDSQTEINYFMSRESCQQNCTQYIVCPELTPPENGYVESDGFTGFGSAVSYRCREGYKLRGEEKRSCQKTAIWLPSAPICEKQCEAPSPVKHSTINPVDNFYDVGTLIFYICEQGYSTNIMERICERGGVWSEPEPVCEPLNMNFCPEPDLIHNGAIYSPSRAIGDTTTYSCMDGFILIGNAERFCGEDRQWQGEEPVCFKLTLEYYIGDSESTERMDITNGSLSLPAKARNVWMIAASSHPDPFEDATAMWFFNNDVLLEMEHPHGVEIHGRNRSLKFIKILVSKEQAGNYTIKIGGYSVSFHLIVEDAPAPAPAPMTPVLVFGGPLSRKSNIGRNVTFTCVFEGYPSPNVTWFFHNNTVHSRGGRIVATSMESRITVSHLTIRNVSEADTGDYRCVGQNSHGRNSSNIGILQLIVNNGTQKRRKRWTNSEMELKNSLCKDLESVSLVGTAIKELRRPKSSRLVRKYLFKVERILKGQLGSMSLGAQDRQNLRVILLQSKMEISATKHLQEGAKYILRGRMVCDNMLYILGSHSRHYYIF